jgi:carbonic anhydrase
LGWPTWPQLKPLLPGTTKASAAHWSGASSIRPTRPAPQGHEQSPVDIRGAHLNKALQPIEFHFLAGPVTLENNGHTVIAHVDPGSYIVANGVRYDLVQFHFHHPAEEAVKGKLTDMDVHLLYKSADGKQAVVAVRLTEDITTPPNAVLSTLWPHLPTKTGQTEKVTDMVNPGGFLPADRGYWTYMGSLTIPPCTEGVRWFILEQDSDPQPRPAARATLFAALFKVNSSRPCKTSTAAASKPTSSKYGAGCGLFSAAASRSGRSRAIVSMLRRPCVMLSASAGSISRISAHLVQLRSTEPKEEIRMPSMSKRMPLQLSRTGEEREDEDILQS